MIPGGFTTAVDQHRTRALPSASLMRELIGLLGLPEDGVGQAFDFLSRFDRDCLVCEARGRTSSVTLREAREALQRPGVTAYLPSIEINLPGLLDVVHRFRQPGWGPGSAGLYVTSPRGGTEAHFDRNENVAIQLLGEKCWHVQRRSEQPGVWLDSHDPREPVPGPPPPLELTRVVPGGSLIYVPRGAWHATRCRRVSVTVNLTYAPAIPGTSTPR